MKPNILQPAETEQILKRLEVLRRRRAMVQVAIETLARDACNDNAPLKP